MENKTIYLPLFGGFYHSIHCFDDSYEVDNFANDNEELCKGKSHYEIQGLFDEQYDTDNEKYEKDYCRYYTDCFKNIYGKGLKEVGFGDIEFVSISSPREYNFSSDEINVRVEYDFNKIVQYLVKHKEKFSKYIEKKNKSCDGFMAYGSTIFETYVGRGTFEEFELTQIMDFYIKVILKHEQDDFIELHYATTDDIVERDYLILNKNIKS